MDEDLMIVWLDEIWVKYVKKINKELGLENSLLTYDAFSAHKTDTVASKLNETNQML